MKRILTILLFSVTLIFGATASESATAAFVEGCRFYSEGEWASARMLLKKAVGYPENINPDVYYMLIAAEIYDGDFRGALDDSNVYLDVFPDSLYVPNISFHKGLALYNLGEYEKSVIALSDFCHQFEDSELYSSALFYIGESLFASYQYDEAADIFERIVREFPDAPKAAAAQYRIESILQRAREEKLLYLLRQTGEEYLAAKEDYERQLRMYKPDSADVARQRLAEETSRNEELERQIVSLESQLSTRTDDDALGGQNPDDFPDSEVYDDAKEQIRMLKEKALQAQRILEGRQ